MTNTPPVQHLPQENKFCLAIEGRESCLEYERSGEGAMVVTHTFVDPSDRGSGVAGALTREALDYARASGLRVVPQCSYVRVYIEKHPEYHPLLAD